MKSTETNKAAPYDAVLCNSELFDQELLSLYPGSVFYG